MVKMLNKCSEGENRTIWAAMTLEVLVNKEKLSLKEKLKFDFLKKNKLKKLSSLLFFPHKIAGKEW